MTTSENGISILSHELDYLALREYIDILLNKYEFLECEYLGNSVLGRPIPMLKLGHGRAKFLYVGAHHGMERITSSLLLRFADDYGSLVKSSGRIYNMSAPYLFSAATVYVIPMLNPDGVEISLKGNGDDLLSERRLKYNCKSEDFSSWQANARGVDLNHNYDCGFYEYKKLEAEMGITDGAPTRYSGVAPESESETASLCNFIRYHGDIRRLLTLHTQGEEIYSGHTENIPRARAICRVMEKTTGYTAKNPSGAPSYGGLTDWFTKEFLRPAYTLECGLGKNPLPPSDLEPIYGKLKKLLFIFPMIK